MSSAKALETAAVDHWCAQIVAHSAGGALQLREKGAAKEEEKKKKKCLVADRVPSSSTTANKSHRCQSLASSASASSSLSSVSSLTSVRQKTSHTTLANSHHRVCSLMVRAIDFSSRLSTADEETKQGSFELRKKRETNASICQCAVLFCVFGSALLPH